MSSFDMNFSSVTWNC